MRLEIIPEASDKSDNDDPQSRVPCLAGQQCPKCQAFKDGECRFWTTASQNSALGEKHSENLTILKRSEEQTPHKFFAQREFRAS